MKCVIISAVASVALAASANGQSNVRAWGFNDYGQCSVPTDLGACTAIAAGVRHSIALRADGTVRAWGANVNGQCSVPTDLGVCTAIAGGGLFTVAKQFVPCRQDINEDGVVDSKDLAELLAAWGTCGN